MDSVLALLVSILVTPLLAFSFNFDRSAWQAIKIPGAKCGSGSDYEVYYKKNASDKLLIEFMGGGACWSKTSCTRLPMAWVHPIIKLPFFSVLTNSESELNPFPDHSNLYFPYCTGDVFTGNHISNYNGTKIYHYGYRNIDLTMKYLGDKGIINYGDVKKLILWGASAGGIGALTHGKNIAQYLPADTRKIVIGDSIGLHFGPRFWDRFDSDAKKDFKTAFNAVHLDVDFNDGFVARRMGPLLEYYQDWKMGFLYGLGDRAMSIYFGKISQKDYQKLIVHPEGLQAISRNYQHVQFWLSDASEHIYLVSKKTSQLKSLDGITAIDFVKSVAQ